MSTKLGTVHPAPNCCWQIDAFAWSLADGTPVAIHQVIDDHTRMAVASLVADGETAKAAVQVVSTAIRRWGVPQRLLSDNGLAFNPTRRGFTGKLVDYLTGLGVKPITGKPDHPMTQGKNERFHQTLQKWLNARPPAATIARLQALVDQFDQYYNHERVHQGLAGKTPAQAWAATAPAPEPNAEPRMPPIPASARTLTPSTGEQSATTPPRAATRTPLALHAAVGNATPTVKQNGQVKALNCLFYVATSRAGQQVHVIWDLTTVEIFTHDGEHLIAYPRPTTTGVYYGPRAPRDGTPIKGAGQNPSAGATGTAVAPSPRAATSAYSPASSTPATNARASRSRSPGTPRPSPSPTLAAPRSRPTTSPPSLAAGTAPPRPDRPRSHETSPRARCPETHLSTTSRDITFRPQLHPRL